MSDTVIKFIPTTPSFVPKKEAVKEVGNWMKTNISSDDISITLTDEIRFIDQGVNFQRIICPLCSGEINMDWWSEKMDKASEHQFTELHVKVPCCDGETSLNDLQYDWCAGFARFSIEILNPSSENINHCMNKLEEKLFCSIKKVVAYY